MILSAIETINLYEAINKLGLNELAVKPAFILLENLEKIEGRVEAFAKLEKELVEECMDKEKSRDIDKGLFQVKEEKKDYFKKRRREMYEEEFEFDLEKINLDDLDGIKIDMESLGKLRPIIER